MNIKEHLSSLLGRVKRGLARFLPTAIYSAAFFCVFTAAIYSDGNPAEYLSSIALAGVLAVAVRLALERRNAEARAVPIAFAITLPLGALCCFLLKRFEASPYTPMCYAGVVIAALFAILWLLYDGADDEKLFAHLVAKAVFCGAVASVLFAGLSLCIAAFSELIFDMQDSGNLYGVAGALSFTVVWLNLFLSYLPQKGAQVEISKVYRALVANVALPVYLLLLAILYGYIIKIVASWTMPVGRMNWYASFALLCYVLLWLGIRFEKVSRLVAVFTKYVGWAMIPIIIVQLVGVAIRLAAYGLTNARYVSLVCLALGVAVLVLSLLGKPVRPMFLAAAVAALLVTVTPLNAIDAPVFEQQQRLKNVLAANDMYYGETITPSSSLSEASKERIVSCYDYLRRNAPNLERNAFLAQATQSDFKSVYGFSLDGKQSIDRQSLSCNGELLDDRMDISGYDTLIFLDGHNEAEPFFVFEINTGENTMQLDLTEELNALYDELGEGYHTRSMEYQLDDGTKVVLSYVHMSYLNGEPEAVSVNGRVLVKDSADQAA